ncbi:Myosin light chain kinase family member 4 [Oryzias melastigma]|uniref:Myosin light chain kinase family member 4 n=1 Tax=Oryzias melastigma TaxID=30732 RepID=A0A834FHF1_ORYME|nr:Myosin light chain kinase family member 4 [Oryzias melastigma]
MENFLKDKDLWILGSVCLVATFLWRRLWKLFSVKKEKKTSSQADAQAKDDKDKAKQSLKGIKAQKKRKPVDSSENTSLSEPVLQEQVEKLNRQNTEHSHANTEADAKKRGKDAELIPDGPQTSASQTEKRKPEKESAEEEDDGDVFVDTEPEEEEEQQAEEDGTEKSRKASSSKRRVTEEDLVKDDLKKSRVEDGQVENADRQVAEASRTEDTDESRESAVKEFIVDLSPPPSAPFDHRIVTPKPHQIATYYTIKRDEVLGGGRFGQVHKCIENSSGLTLAAKIIKARSQKEKEVVRNEIQVMNQLNHANLIQLYAAFESRHDIILVMEYVEGGELFDRIIDENYNLTELDTVLFIRQICEGLQYMHKMYILHLDLKPENILCVSRATNKIKIIDFGPGKKVQTQGEAEGQLWYA